MRKETEKTLIVIVLCVLFLVFISQFVFERKNYETTFNATKVNSPTFSFGSEIFSYEQGEELIQTDLFKLIYTH